MTAKIQSALQAEIDTLLADNADGDISALDIRTVTENIMDTLYNPTVEDAVAGTVLAATKFTRSTTHGTPTIGIGVSIGFEVETAAANFELGATIEAVTTNVGSGTEAFDLVFKLMDAGTLAEVFKITSTGPLKLLESAAAVADTTGYGQLWVKNNAPNDLYFTDDTGQEVQITDNGIIAGSFTTGKAMFMAAIG